jgi:hypothetical protein
MADTELFLVRRSSLASSSSAVIGRSVTACQTPYRRIQAGAPERSSISDMPSCVPHNNRSLMSV